MQGKERAGPFHNTEQSGTIMSEASVRSAYIWAGKVRDGAIPLMHLKKGERFIYCHEDPATAIPRIYRGRGWVTKDGKTYRTGMKTAVLQVR